MNNHNFTKLTTKKFMIEQYSNHIIQMKVIQTIKHKQKQEQPIDTRHNTIQRKYLKQKRLPNIEQSRKFNMEVEGLGYLVQNRNIIILRMFLIQSINRTQKNS